ncbi:MinD/ParA family protein [Pseudarthrobacter sp. NPDC058329]|uniref:MinD/ParA family ATP-binding protein n=1 Tax=Pseudarthrobacter sp. NPDC058329 TaxID=3346448 RepID=UPI0036DBC14B
MAIEKSLIQPEPVISAIINGDNTGILKINGEEHPYEAPDLNDLRQALMKRAIGEAATLNRPVRVTSMDDAGVSYLVVSPTGEVEEEQPTTVPEDASTIIEAIPSTRAATTTVAAAKPAPPLVREATPAAPSAVAGATTRRSIREAESFLAAPSTVEPATQGIRGMLNSLGLSIAPSEDELSEREDVRLASKHFAGTRTIAVVNQKGGSNKTPTVADLAAVFGRNGGSVVAWDNNPTTGTLGWRTEQGDHSRSALDVIANAEALLSPTAQSADINAFVHHQSTDKYDVLRSDSDVDGTHEVTAEEVDILHRVVSKYYRLILMDSGNNHRSAEWNRMIDHADQLVVPTTNEEDRVEAALLTLQGLDLKSERSAGLAANAVVVVSERQEGEARLSQETAEKFRPYVRDVVVVPFDPALKSGQIRFGALKRPTRRAWLRAAAAVARGL